MYAILALYTGIAAKRVGSGFECEERNHFRVLDLTNGDENRQTHPTAIGRR